MSTSYTERLFYVVKKSDTAYSLYSIQTDHLILAEVAPDAISDFLFLNEPHNPAISYLEKVSLYDSHLNDNSKDALDYYTTLSTYDLYDAYDPTEVTQWGNITLNNLTLDDSDKQLSFNFSSGLEEKCEDILTNFATNSSEPHVVTGKSHSSKTQYDPGSEWKILNIDDD